MPLDPLVGPMVPVAVTWARAAPAMAMAPRTIAAVMLVIYDESDRIESPQRRAR